MDNSDVRAEYEARCHALAEQARARGIELSKRDDAPEIEATAAGISVAFPVVTDSVAWKQTSTEAAFYAAMQDAKSFKRWTLDEELLAILDEAERAKLPPPRQDVREQSERLRAFSRMLGGSEAVDAFLETVESF
jgi:hypothetical protein